MLHGYLPAAVPLARKLDSQKLDFAVDCAMWNDFFFFFSKGKVVKGGIPLHGSKYRRISSKYRRFQVPTHLLAWFLVPMVLSTDLFPPRTVTGQLDS